MTILQKTYQILKQDNKQLSITEWSKPTRPEHSFKINSFNIPENRQKAKTREYLAKALAFIDMKKQVRYADGFTVMAISVNNKRILSMFNKCQSSVTRWLHYLEMIGLIAEYESKYRFSKWESYSKKYVYSYEAEQKIKEYCNINNINKYQIRNYNNNNSIQLRSINNFERESVVFSSKLNLLKPENWSVTQFEEYLTECLYENYPQLKHYQMLADKINDTYYKDDIDRQIQFAPTFTWRKGDKCVIKIGIRATNPLVSAKKEYNSKDKEWTVHKDEIFNKYGLKYHYDVKSSVPRLTYFLNKGEWLDNSIDLYELMFNKFIHICPTEAMEWNAETRKIFKDFHMRGYFDTEAKIGGHIKRIIAQKTDYNKSEWDNLNYVMASYKHSIIDVVGNLYDNEIFFHESCIYMDVLEELLNRGTEVWQVYDEWNTNKEIEDIYEIIENKANNYYDKYIENNKEINNNNSIQLRDYEETDVQLCENEPISMEELIEQALGIELE